MNLRFYDDTVREGLAELSDTALQERLWRGAEPGMVSSPFECCMTIFEDSGLAMALAAGEAYGEPTDGLLRRLHTRLVDLDLDRSIDELESDRGFARSRRLAREVLISLTDRPLGTVRGEPLGPIRPR